MAERQKKRKTEDNVLGSRYLWVETLQERCLSFIFFEKWNVVITVVIKGEQEMFHCGVVLFQHTLSSTLLNLITFLHTK